MFSEVVRKYSQGFLETLARFISATGLSPNVVTIIGFFLIIGVAIVLSQGYFFLGGFLIIGVTLFDAIDGAMARMTGRASRFGAFLDSTLDRYSEAVIFFGLFIYFIGENKSQDLILIYAAMVGSLMVSYARARAEGIGVPLKDGLLSRFERIFILCTGLFGDWLFGWLTLALWLLAIFSNLTAFQRMYLVWRITGGEEGG